MKHLSIIALLILFSSHSIAQESSFEGKSYLEVKRQLVSDGWTVAEDKANTNAKTLPEVDCGSGLDSICSAAFTKNGQHLALALESKGGQLIVIGEY
ncbi:hypothetical protein [Vibrio sp. LaRot3]|uniref:hypothetical protein n=1 Tax=Vibrio sp. LaRot3 TaxID=2998829 RepID=UPI0022CDE464|nr:hypothetical protein [Vibrio sp. LaRot3]MDA0147415.1 hypothetical protein [Vibrio sp. LaRot3]